MRNDILKQAQEIRRIQETRDTLRAKAIALDVGLSTDNLYSCPV